MRESIRGTATMIEQIKTSIRLGLSKQEILRRQVASGTDNPDLVRAIVEDTVEKYANYSLIQKIMRSKLVADKSDNKVFLIVDPLKQDIEVITKERLKEILHKKLDISDKIYTSKIVYDPFLLKQFEPNDGGIWTFNKYNPPAWLSEHFYSGGQIPVPRVYEIPKVYDKFLNHLVNGDERSYNYILNWIANGIRGRNYCILTTIGKQGIGKGTLAEIMKKIFGESNCTTTGNRILKDKFNAQIKDKRLVYCDEASVRSEEHEERIKALVNDYVEVEGKNVNAEVIKNHANFYFSSNSLDAIKLYADDRRFSIVNLTDKKLLESFKTDEIRGMLGEESISEFARYLYYREVNKDEMMKVFISEQTEKIRAASLNNWHDWFLDEYAIENQDKAVKVTDFGDHYEQKYGPRGKPGRAALQDLESRYPDRFKIAKRRVDGKQVWCIIFNEYKETTDATE
ncbi:MAG: hypothetical protein FMNOHCHN_03769 [Ignavibacteriaceae bacterium]|nr:hypothetical protein [Ignavibacteriaceae bacterium]